MPSLTTLPPELLHVIQSYLDYPAKVTLYATCRTIYRNSLEDPNEATRKRQPIEYVLSRPYTIKDLLAIEKWPKYYYTKPSDKSKATFTLPWSQRKEEALDDWWWDYFACGCCLRLRRAYFFANAMLTGDMGKEGSDVNRKSERECMKCHCRRFQHTSRIFEFGGNLRGLARICRRCGPRE